MGKEQRCRRSLAVEDGVPSGLIVVQYVRNLRRGDRLERLQK